MVKTPKMRQASRPRREPVIIEHDPAAAVEGNAGSDPQEGGSAAFVASPSPVGDALPGSDGNGGQVERTEAPSAGDRRDVVPARLGPDDEAPATGATEIGESTIGESTPADSVAVQPAPETPGEIVAAAGMDSTSASAAVEDGGDRLAGEDETFRAGPVEGMPDEGVSEPAARPAPPAGFGRLPADEVSPLPAAAARPSRTRFAPLLAAAVLGGLVALAGFGLLQGRDWFGSARGSGDIAELKTRMAALEQDAGAAALRDQLAGLDRSVKAAQAEIAALQQAAPAGAADPAAAQGLDERLKALEAAVASLGQGNAAADQAALAERIASLEAAVKSAGDAAAGADQRFASLEGNVSALSKRVDDLAGQPRAALAIAVGALRAAIERGAPFAGELETFAAVAPDAPGLDELRRYADAGVPQRAEIASGVDAAANAMLAAGRAPDPNAGFLSRLLGSAGSLVSVRPIGAVEGAGVPETVSRFAAAAKAGDYAGAVKEFESLPDTVKQAGAEFAARLRARLAAEQLSEQAIAAAMKM